VVNLAGEFIASRMAESAAKRPDLFGLDERSLFKLLRQEGAAPTPTDNCLRLRFWEEYERCHATAGTSKGIQDVRVYAGVCTRQFFYDRYLVNPIKVAWMLTPPTSYVTHATEALNFGLQLMREYLEIDARSPDGKINVKLMELQAKITAMLDQRVKGAVVQRVEQKNMNLNVQTSDAKVASALVGQSMEDINARIKQLEKKAAGAGLGAQADVIDVDPLPTGE
jgi:hypothetical protein